MNSDKFIDVIKLVVRDAAIEDTISILGSPPGRKPSKELVELSEFYNGMTDKDKVSVNNIIKRAVDDAVFGFLCVIDGVRAIEDGEDKGELTLTYSKGNLPPININEDNELHDIFNAE